MVLAHDVLGSLEVEPGSLHEGGDTQAVHHKGVAHRCLHVSQKLVVLRACGPVPCQSIINILKSARESLEVSDIVSRWLAVLSTQTQIVSHVKRSLPDGLMHAYQDGEHHQAGHADLKCALEGVRVPCTLTVEKVPAAHHIA